jgi:acetyl esterase/lipase
MAAAQDFVHKNPSIHWLNVETLSNVSTREPPETFLLDTLKLRPRAMSHHLSCTKVPSRLWLKIQARMWRAGMSLGMQFHDLCPPKPPKATFVRKIPTDTVPISLHFYTPPNYYSLLASGNTFPVVVNFHGGGFCLGDPTDDRYWARVVLERTNAVFVSVGYRRAPEHPFPIPVDDSVEALIYLSKHASSLGLDTTRVALSGFSAGANLAFAVPLRLKYHTLKDIKPVETLTPSMSASTADHRPTDHLSADHLSPNHLSPNHLSPNHLSPNLTSSVTNLLRPSPTYQTPIPLTIKSIIAWYPLLDWTTSRAEKKRTSLNPPKCLPKVFTDLFDFSYLPPPDNEGLHCSPYASPGLAPEFMLRDGIPHDIQMWLCEWDMLLDEGKVFASRLDGVGKNVEARIIPKMPHGFDKSPSPFRDQKEIDRLYGQAAGELRTVFES